MLKPSTKKKVFIKSSQKFIKFPKTTWQEIKPTFKLDQDFIFRFKLQRVIELLKPKMSYPTMQIEDETRTPSLRLRNRKSLLENNNNEDSAYGSPGLQTSS